MVAVAGLLWISWCGLGAARFRVLVSLLFFERTRPAASIRPPCLIYLSTSNEARPRERSARGLFLPIGKKPLHTGVRTGCHYLINLSVCMSVCMCNIRRFTDCESCTRPISTNPGSMKSGEHGLTSWTCYVARRLEVVAVAGCCGFRGVF